jgi:hypothetical protein
VQVLLTVEEKARLLEAVAATRLSQGELMREGMRLLLAARAGGLKLGAELVSR